MSEVSIARAATVDPRKFRDPDITASGERRARVDFRRLATLWFNTGTLCNLIGARAHDIELSNRRATLGVGSEFCPTPFLGRLEPRWSIASAI